MTDEPHNLILEHLRALHAGQERLEGDLRDVRRCLGNVESGLAGLRSEVALVHTAISQHDARMDEFSDRLTRIEKRLDLVDA